MCVCVRVVGESGNSILLVSCWQIGLIGMQRAAGQNNGKVGGRGRERRALMAFRITCFFHYLHLATFLIMQPLCNLHRQYIMQNWQKLSTVWTQLDLIFVWPHKTIFHVAKVAQLPQHMLANIRQTQQTMDNLMVYVNLLLNCFPRAAFNAQSHKQFTVSSHRRCLLAALSVSFRSVRWALMQMGAWPTGRMMCHIKCLPLRVP